MSVPKSKRSTPQVKFIQDTYKARKKTLEVLKKFPKGYKFNLPSRIAELADNAYWAAYAGNCVYMHKNMSYEDYAYRRKCLLKSYTTMRALTAEASFCYELVMDGDNFFENAKVRSKTFSDWTALCAEASGSIKAIMESDRKRYKGYPKKDTDELRNIEAAIDAMNERNKTQTMEIIRESRSRA